jgi:valyl-tRNA synthetase
MLIYHRWGHQIPAWQIVFEDGSTSQEEQWVVARSQDEAVTQAEKKYPGRKFRLERDPDCLE